MRKDDADAVFSIWKQQVWRSALGCRLGLVDLGMLRLPIGLPAPGVPHRFVVKMKLGELFLVDRRHAFEGFFDRAPGAGQWCDFVGVDEDRVLDAHLIEVVFLT